MIKTISAQRVKPIHQKRETIPIVDNSNQGRQTQTFDEKYKRMTNYIEHEIFHQIMELKHTGKIHTIKGFVVFVNDALKAELKKY